MRDQHKGGFNPICSGKYCECRHTNLSMLTEHLSPSLITGCSGLSFCTELLSSVHTVACSLPGAHLGKLLRSWWREFRRRVPLLGGVKKQSWVVNITSNECPISHKKCQSWNASLGFLYSSFHGPEEIS